MNNDAITGTLFLVGALLLIITGWSVDWRIGVAILGGLFIFMAMGASKS